MQRTLNELIDELEKIRQQVGGDVDVHSYGADDWKHFHGVDCILWDYDDCDRKFVVIMHDGWV